MAGQFGGLVKLGSGYCHAASFVAPSAQYASSGVRRAGAQKRRWPDRQQSQILTLHGH
jgi:hypothetical protein